MGKQRFAITYAYDKRKRAFYPDKIGNIRAFKTKQAAKNWLKKNKSQKRIRDPRIRKLKV